jgi:hypothetical protein
MLTGQDRIEVFVHDHRSQMIEVHYDWVLIFGVKVIDRLDAAQAL